jgi:ribose transport system ATP-binding protein
MVARDISDLYPKRKITIGKPVLKLDTLSLAGKFDNVSLTLGEGEILGLTGLLGSGAKDLIRTLFGLETATNGTVEVKGEVIWSASPAKAAGKRLALVPEDRRKNGVALDLSVSENTTLASLARFTRSGFLDRKAEHKAAEGLIKRLQIKTESGDALVRTLSGGNQQKVAIAKWLSRHSEIYLLDEPTVGVDIAAKVEIYDLIGELASRGAGILILSSDLPELIGITDRVLVMFRGRIISQFISSQTSPDEILAEATGSSETLRHVG